MKKEVMKVFKRRNKKLSHTRFMVGTGGCVECSLNDPLCPFLVYCSDVATEFGCYVTPPTRHYSDLRKYVV